MIPDWLGGLIMYGGGLILLILIHVYGDPGHVVGSCTWDWSC